MKPLRIAFLSPFHPLKGGIAKFSDLLLPALVRRGYDLIPIPFKALYPGFLERSTPPSSGSSSVAGPENGIVLYNPFSWFGTLRLIRSKQPDILLMAYWTGFLAPLYFMLHALTRRKCVILLHNYSSHESWFFEPFMRRLIARFPDAFITLSGPVAREVEMAVPDKPVLRLFHPVYEPAGDTISRGDARKELGIASDASVLLFFGYVRRYKGLDILLDAMPSILEKDPSLRLVVAGQFFDDPAPYREMIERPGISGNVILHEGYVPGEKTGLYFAAADAVVLPYRSATQSGVVQLACGYGVPVITTPVGALPDMVLHGRTGWIARDSSPEGVASAVGEFLSDRRGPEAMKKEIEAFSRGFSWDTFARTAGEFLETIVRCAE
ncbi:MAG: glycosyltransferase [Chlorobiaceae bacterium]|nr:glycosyltransferase [Chlorobiaceae bacterium]NTW11396.1 glycosyltransferase [Chlorobiaceae bacterium]